MFAKISLDTRAFDILATQAISGGIGRLYHNLNIKDTIVEDNNGKVYKGKSKHFLDVGHVSQYYPLAEVTSEGQVSLEERILLPTFCTWIATTRVGRKVEEAEVKYILYTIVVRVLFLNERVIGRCVSLDRARKVVWERSTALL